MNPYLRAARARHEAIRQEIQTLQTRADQENRDISAEELATITRVVAEGTDLAAAITTMEAEHAQESAVSNAAARVAEDQHRAAGHERLGGRQDLPDPYADLGAGDPVPALMPSRAQVAELYRAAQGGERPVRLAVDQAAAHHRATITTAQTGTPAAELEMLTREPRRISTAARLGTQRVSGVEGVAFPVFGAGAANVTAQGAAKTEYAAITPGAGTPQMIAVWTDYSRQTMLTVTSFEARLRQKHAALIAKREDLLLVATVQGTTGTQTLTGATAEPPAETLLEAAALVLASDVGAAPDLAVVHPSDVARIFGSGTGMSGESPENDLRLNLHGMAVYVSPAVAAGAAVVGAWSAAARFIVGLPPTVLVDGVSGLKTNTITSLMEEAVALAVDEPTGFVEVTFAAAA